LFNLYYLDDQNTNRIPNLGITWWDFLIILRKICMRNFTATQYGVQSLRFYYNDTDDFIPFLCGSGTSSSDNTTTMKLPLFAVENLNALRARVVYPNVNPVTGKQLDKYPRMYVPVLGIYLDSTFLYNEYNYEDGKDLVNIFGGPLDPTIINLVDGQLNKQYVDFDTSPIISANMTQWNKVMGILSPYIQQPTMYTGDQGVNVLTVIGDAYFVKKIPQDMVKKIGINNNNKSIRAVKKDDKEAIIRVVSKKDEKEIIRGKPKITVYEKVVTHYLSQQVPIIDIVGIKKAFWIPEWKYFVQNSNPVGNVAVDTIRSLNLMVWVDFAGQRYNTSTDGDYMPMEELRTMFTANCIKNRNADNDTFVKQILALTEAGRAGLLGDLVSTFGGELVSGAIRTAASFISL
jgi:hypothetical protein